MLHKTLSAVLSAALLLTGALTIGGTQTARASWTLTTTAAPARAAATVMPTGQLPTARGTNLGVLGYSYTVTWPSTPMANGNPVTGYIVTRGASSGGGSALAGGTCAPVNLLGLTYVAVIPATTGSTQTCTETSLVSLGTPRYQVTPVYGNWRGAPSAWGLAT